MAEALLKAWRAPSLVAAVEIDAAGNAARRSDNTDVVDVVSDGKRLTWVQTDRALPMPVNPTDPVVDLALRSSDFVEALDQEPLQVAGLAEGVYTLKIDGTVVGKFSAQQLSAGINLATLPTPMAQQAAQVHMLTVKHNAAHFARWREVQVPLEGTGVDAAAAERALDDLEDRMIAAQHAAAQPRPRYFEVLAE
jgi:hypothetical protein